MITIKKCLHKFEPLFELGGDFDIFVQVLHK